MGLYKKTQGGLGESAAATYLQQNGYTVLERNWYSRYAEIDIVAIEDDTLVFVEVKTRTSDAHGSPEESITSFKIHSLVRASQLYKSTHQSLPDALRIDFVGVEYRKGKITRINLIKNIVQ